jgi:hypothetical protein
VYQQTSSDDAGRPKANSVSKALYLAECVNPSVSKADLVDRTSQGGTEKQCGTVSGGGRKLHWDRM